MRRFGGLVWLAGVVAGSLTYAAPNAPRGAALRMVQGRPVVQGVYVNGHGPYSFLLDTGTTANHLDLELARAIGLKPAFRSELVSSTGVVYAPGAEGIEVTVDSVRAEGQRFLFAGIDTIRQIAPGIQGILGQTFLSHFDYRLDLRGKRIEFGKREPRAAEIRVPLRMAEARPIVSTSLGELVLDSGTSWVTLFGVEAGNTTGEMTTLSGTLRIGTVARKLLIEGHAFWRGAALAVPRSPEAGAEGLLPVGLFKSVYFSNSEHYVSFE